MRELETSLQQFGEFMLKAQLVNEMAAPYCVRWVRRFLMRAASDEPLADQVRGFCEELERSGDCRDWQVRQARAGTPHLTQKRFGQSAVDRNHVARRFCTQVASEPDDRVCAVGGKDRPARDRPLRIEVGQLVSQRLNRFRFVERIGDIRAPFAAVG